MRPIRRGGGDMILADDSAACADAMAAARLVGLPALPQIGWAEADAELSGAASALLLVETTGVPDATLARVLPAVARLVREAGSAAVVALEAGQIDLVAAFLLADRVQLLCAPTLADRAAALVLARATGGGGRLRDPGGGDADAERLASLAGEVARIGTALAEIAARRERGAAVADRAPDYTPPPPEPADVAVTAAELRGAIRARRLRDSAFGPGWFEDPAWDILLDLFAAELEGTAVSVSSLCIAAAVAPTTALRWISRMTAAGLLVRRDDRRDRRRAFMHLSDAARAAMIRYQATVRQAGLPIA